ncbi:sushi, von Willebrand factor type A, EGF and pentraxin domain-containing protein 1-like [Ruditapes philippinarum]|uniref:sushi, von Willebrand factor type A, EGF and pentraxin domain-containing protein 1-like n=1 Tax=Ruditapes philippinarum TaxID=129788 RepID=UPI00295B5287|nr:sushi, von Willebrand factor type A, EGF and pentraxin domain-containing protein 1-like [Ruditapes philippinarum]
MIPSNVQHSTCENNLRWEPPPPKCLKKADRYVPNDGYLRGWKRGKVSHGESYKICCDKGFEVEGDDNVPVNKEECTNIRNNNGTLEPSVACVEEWCEPDRLHTEYKHEDGSEFTSRIPSNEDVWISCEKGYALYNSRNKLLLSPQRRRCVQGQIKDTPTCNEAKSLLAGYPYNEFTFYQDRKENRLDRETYIEPNERIEVYCSDGYELYVEFYQEYLDQFTTTSRHGSFDKEKNDFPVCREKRCNPNSLKHAGAKYENETQVDFSTKIQSGTYIFVFCQRGFAFYDDNGQAIETMQKRHCMKGTIVDAPKCQEAKCSLVEYPSNQYTSYYNLNLKAIIEPKADYIKSSHKIEVNCTNDKEYELYVNASNKYVDTFKTKCDHGTFNRRKKKFPVCVEKRCSFEPSNAQGACFLTDDGGNCKREQFNIQSGSSIHIKCKQGYTLFVSKKEVKGQKIITCNKGSHPDFSCTANDCSAPGVNNTEPLSTSVYNHNEEVTYKCNKGYWFSKSKFGEKKIIFFKSTCSLGNWTNHIPRTCEPVACFLNVQAGTEYSIYGTGKDILNSSFVENGTSIGVRCKDGFDLYDDADTLINDTNVVPEVTCHVGEWSNKHWCKERCYIPNRANIQFSKDGENLTINDTIKHMESVNITCTGEQGTFSSFINCENGKFDQHDKCTSGNDLKSSISTSTISTASAENVNNQQQNVNEAPDDSLAEMEDYYDQIEEQRNKSKVSVINSLIGSCRLPEMENMAKLNTRRTHYAIGETVRDFTCSRGYFLSSDKGMTCQNNGTWSDVITCVKGCNLSDDERYKYLNMNGDEIKPGDNLVVGDTLTLQCRFIDMYSYLTYDYDYIDADTPADDITISCKDDHTMTNIEKECPEEPKHDKCLKVVNGNVKISNSYYVVSCDKGFSLDIFEPEEKRSNCIDGKLKSVIGGQEPKCIPDRCKVPYEYDTRLSIYDKFRVSLSGGSVVEVGHFVYFNCSKAGDDMYEPVNRRFKCINGQWIEDERDKLWKFGNNGTFPECRKTICEPECEIGGVCLRDDECKCKHFTSGKHCEDVLCDDKCKTNNGECVGPGKCRCPQGKFGTNCELISCRPPEIENMAKLNPSRTHYAIGETIRDLTCNHGHFLSSDKGMTCQNNGTWSDVITCVKGICENKHMCLFNYRYCKKNRKR